MVAPAPGRQPSRKPVTEPLRKAKRQALSSSQLGSRLRMPRGTGSTCASSPASMLASTSEMAKTPMAITMTSMPPSSTLCPKMKRDCAVKMSVPMLVSQSPSSIDSSPLISDGPDSSTTSARPRHISAKYSGELNDSAKAATGGAIRLNAITPKVPAMNEAIAGDAERRAGAAVARHLIAVDAGHDRGGLARDIEQDRGGRAAVFGAVIDAGHHDDAAGRVHLVGQRQQHRDGRGRPEPRQDADDGAEEAADEAPEQIRRLQRDRKSVQQPAEDVHLRTRRSRSGAAPPAPPGK